MTEPLPLKSIRSGNEAMHAATDVEPNHGATIPSFLNRVVEQGSSVRFLGAKKSFLWSPSSIQLLLGSPAS